MNQLSCCDTIYIIASSGFIHLSICSFSNVLQVQESKSSTTEEDHTAIRNCWRTSSKLVLFREIKTIFIYKLQAFEQVSLQENYAESKLDRTQNPLRNAMPEKTWIINTTISLAKYHLTDLIRAYMKYQTGPEFGYSSFYKSAPHACNSLYANISFSILGVSSILNLAILNIK